MQVGLLVDLGYAQLTADVSVYTQLGGFLEKSNGPAQAISTGYQSLPIASAGIARQQGVKIDLDSKLKLFKGSQAMTMLFYWHPTKELILFSGKQLQNVQG